MSAPSFDLEDDEGQETGKGLRKKLEEVLEVNRKITAELTAERSARLINEKGFTLVKPEDLKDIPLDQLEAKAAEINQSRTDQKVDILKDVLRNQGVAEGELDERAKQMLTPISEQSVAPAQLNGIAALGKVAGTAPSSKTDVSELHGRDKLAAAFAAGIKA